MKLPPLALSQQEIKMVMLYRTVAPAWQDECVAFCNSMSRMFPAKSVDPVTAAGALRLVTNLSKRVPKRAAALRRPPRSTSSSMPRSAPAVTRAAPNNMDGARAALAFRVDGERIGAPHPVGTAAADAFFSGIEEGHAIWRRAGGTALASSASTRRQLQDIETYAVDIGAQAEHIDILLQSVFEKLDALGDDSVMVSTSASTLAAIACYVTCALRCAALVAEAKDHIIALATEGGAT